MRPECGLHRWLTIIPQGADIISALDNTYDHYILAYTERPTGAIVCRTSNSITSQQRDRICNKDFFQNLDQAANATYLNGPFVESG